MHVTGGVEASAQAGGGDLGASAAAAERIREQLERAVDRLRSTGEARLARPGADGTPSVADEVLGLAQRVADVTADCSSQPRRQLPRLAAIASGDLLAVVMHDLLDVAPAVPAAVLAEIDHGLAALRRRL